MQNILTFDIEDNFTKDELASTSDWDLYERQVVDNTNIILELLFKHHVTATFFVLGKVAARHPEVVENIFKAGHEIASHGFIHERVDLLGKKGFLDDIVRSKEVIEAITGATLKGFRAMAFSIDADTSWALDIIRDQGFNYDSSILSTTFSEHASQFRDLFAGTLHEIAPTALKLSRINLTLGGGVFFRLGPFCVIRYLIHHINKNGHPFIIYSHAWEFNKDQPKRKVSFTQSIAQSPLTYTTHHRLERLLKEFSFTSIANYMEPNK